MRTLGGTYNLPSREAIIEQIYRRVGPTDSPSPPTGEVAGRPRLEVRPLPLAGPRQLQVEWRLDGAPVDPQPTDRGVLDTSQLTVEPGRSVTVSAVVRDGTDWVRDEEFRDRYMTRTVSWTLRG